MPPQAPRKSGRSQRAVITGVKEIDRALKQLPGNVARKVIRKAMRAAMKPVAMAVKANAPVRTGQTKKAVKIRAGKTAKGRLAVEVRVGKGDYKGDQYYAAFQEFGWKPGKRGGPRGEPVPGKHFMERAFDATKSSAKQAAIAGILAGVEAEVKALRKT